VGHAPAQRRPGEGGTQERLELTQQTKKKSSGKKRRRSRRRRKPNPDYIPQPTGPTEPGGGVLDVANDGSGTLRSEENSFLPGDGDIYVPPGLIKMHSLQAGSMVEGQIGEPKKAGQKPLLCEVDTVDGLPPDERKDLDAFGKLIVVDPEPQLVLEPGQGEDGDVSLRVIDLLSPIGKGQRGLIVAPPQVRARRSCSRRSAKAINEHYHRKCHADRAAHRRASRRGDRQAGVAAVENGEVISLDALTSRPAQPRAGRRDGHFAARSSASSKVGQGRRHSSWTRSRDWPAPTTAVNRRWAARSSSRAVSKRQSAAKSPRSSSVRPATSTDGGSLTILGTALIETGSRMDHVIFEEFKGTGNMELVLSRQLAERRIYPAIDIELSGTRKEELLLPRAVIDRVYTLRRVLAKMHSLDAMPLLIDRLMKTESNLDFLNSFKVKE
jgi:transcription termination factor Rho